MAFTRFIVLVIVATLVFVLPAEALTVEFYVYNGFDSILSVLQFVALIFSDATYQQLFTVVIVLGIVFGGAGATFRGFMSGEYSLLGWTLPILIGVIIYFGLIKPTSTIRLYDPVQNKTQAQAGIPNGIAVTMSILNKVEKGLIDIINTAGPVGMPDYNTGAGGIGFNFLLSAHSVDRKFDDAYQILSLKTYIEDCLFFELTRPGSTLSINDIKTSSNLMTELAEGSNPGRSTTYYSEADRRGSNMTCSNVWTNLNNYFGDDAKYEDIIKSTCAAGGMDPDDPAQLARCKVVMGEYASLVEGSGGIFSSVDYIRQVVLADTLDYTIKSANPDEAVLAIANQQYVSNGISAGMVANEYVPIFRTVVLSLSIALIPFLVLFIPTPLYGEALKIMFGFFIFNTAWGVADTITFQMAQAQAVRVFEEVTSNGIGFTAMMLTPKASMKALAIFGYMRTAGVMLALILTKGLVDFGGHAMAQLGSSFQGGMQSAGVAGSAVSGAKPVEELSKQEQIRRSGGMASWANSSATQDIRREEALRKMTATKGAQETIDMIGGGNVGKAAQGMGHSNAISNTTNAARASHFDKGIAKKSGDASAGREIGMIEGFGDDVFQQARDASKTMTEKNVAAANAMRGAVQNYAKQKGMGEKQAWDEWEKFSVADRAEQAKLYGNAEDYRKLYAETAQQKGKAAMAGTRDQWDMYKAAFPKTLNTPEKVEGHLQKGGMVTDEMADDAQANGYEGVLPGMKINSIAYDEKNGRLQLNTSMAVDKNNIDQVKALVGKTDPANAEAIKEGMMLTGAIDARTGEGEWRAGKHMQVREGSDIKKDWSRSGNFSKDEVKDMSAEVRQLGHIKTADRLDKMTASMGANESLHGEFHRGSDGSLSYMNMKHGTEAVHMDKGVRDFSGSETDGITSYKGAINSANKLNRFKKEAEDAGFENAAAGLQMGMFVNSTYDDQGKMIGLGAKREGETGYKDMLGKKTGSDVRDVDINTEEKRRGSTDTSDVHVGRDNVSQAGFHAGGMTFASASVHREGGQITIKGTTIDGYNVTMKGDGKGQVGFDDKGKLTGLKGFRLTKVEAEKGKEVKNVDTYIDKKQVEVLRNSQVVFSNLNALIGDADPEEWARENPGTIAAYGAGGNMWNNFIEATRGFDAGRRVMKGTRGSPRNTSSDGYEG